MLQLHRFAQGKCLLPMLRQQFRKVTSNAKQQALKVPNTKTEKLVGKWMIGCGAMVSGAVILGGMTRLTESGLSMVTWKALGEKMPSNEAEWEAEFMNYKQFPEFKMKNSNMTLEEFRFIYYMEYLHRMWGRAIGAVYAIPAIYFWKKGYLNSSSKKLVTALGLLIGAQGLMGWYMVKSGLEDRFNDVNDVPRVSQYRLASHLGLAFLIYVTFLSGGLKKLFPAQIINTSEKLPIRIRHMAYLIKGMVFFTAISGAFVAGLDAGLVYSSFPKMGGQWIPDEILAQKPTIKNFTENPVTVQFDHRLLGISTLCLSTLVWLLSRRVQLSKRSHFAINSMAAMAWAQASLGILTLINHVPVSLGSLHQTGSLLLLSLAFWATHELRFLKYVPK